MPTPSLRLRARLIERFSAAPGSAASVFWRSERYALVRYTDHRRQLTWEEVEIRNGRRTHIPGYGGRLDIADGGAFEPAAISADGAWLLGRRGETYEAVARDGDFRRWLSPPTRRDLHWRPDGRGFVEVGPRALRTFWLNQGDPSVAPLTRPGIGLGHLPTGELVLATGGLPAAAPALTAVAEASTVRPLGTLRLPRGPRCVALALSPRGDRLAVQTGKSLWICGVDGKRLQKLGDFLHPDAPGSLAWLPSGERLSYWHDGALYLILV